MRIDSQAGSAARVVVARIYPGEDMVTAIAEVCRKHGIKYGIITSCIGSLSSIYLQYYYEPKDPVNDPFGADRDLILNEPTVLISGQGLVCENVSDGSMDVHLHAVMRDNNGKVYGSHIPKGGNIAQYTIDVAIMEVSGMRLLRAWEEETHHFETVPAPAEPCESSDC